MANPARRRMAAAVVSLGLLTIPAAASVAGAAAAAATAADDDYVGRTPPTVPTDPVGPRVLGQVETRGEASGTGTTTGIDPIPITGGDVAGLTAIGLAAVATGTVLLRRGRRAPG